MIWVTAGLPGIDPNEASGGVPAPGAKLFFEPVEGLSPILLD